MEGSFSRRMACFFRIFFMNIKLSNQTVGYSNDIKKREEIPKLNKGKTEWSFYACLDKT